MTLYERSAILATAKCLHNLLMQVEGGGGGDGLVCFIQNVSIVPLLTVEQWISFLRWRFVSNTRWETNWCSWKPPRLFNDLSTLTPGSGIGFFRIPDPKPYFWEFSDNFLGKKFYTSLKLGPNFFLQHFKTKIMYSLWNLWLHRKVWHQIFFHLSLLLLFLDPRSGMGKIQDPG